MANTIIMGLFAYGVIGCLNKVGISYALVTSLAKRAKSTLSLAVVTEIIAAIGVCFGHGGISVLLTGSIMAPAYKERGLDPVNLSKVSGALAMPWNAVIPWTTSTIYFLGLFGVAVIEYLPYAPFLFVFPIMALIFVALRIREFPLEEEAKEAAASA